MGKSTSAAILDQIGLPIADTDVIAREVVAPGTPGLEAVRRAFGSNVVLPDNTLDRAHLAERVFADGAAREQLEGILHPLIRAEWERRAARWRAAGHAAGVVVIPLLFETGAENLLDAVICVACSAKSQQERLRDRGWGEEHIRRRIAAQLPIETKMLRAQFVIWTDPPVAVHDDQLRRILNRLGLSS
jgi:dephospho-CoA kinase